ncbi:hypothetical protein ACO2Q0_19400 [Phenylobacterium sp. VNQ135]|uniref:terminase small subunit-like protein n=1 Tax=Phenylobacterium sp. VNQ135 TaxID=3400922 RepID=UPI003C0B1B1C
MAKGKRRPAWRAAVETRVYVRWSEALARRLLERVAAGELIYRICAEDGMPTPEAVAKWAREKPEFGEALSEARRIGGRPAGVRGQPFGLCEATAQAIFERLCEGESLTAIGRDPTMPSLSTIFYWRRRFPEFEDAVQIGKRIQAEMWTDRACKLAEAVTPQTAYAVDVQLKHLRWVAGVNAPKVFRIKPVEPEVREEPKQILFRLFKIEEDPETGEKTVVGYVPNPETGRAEREATTTWRPGPNQIPMPGGRDGWFGR